VNPPKNVHDALRHIDNLLVSAGDDLERYLMSENPAMEFSPEYFESVKDAVLDARLLAVWVRDQLKVKE
jgi:hypothetical protein